MTDEEKEAVEVMKALTNKKLRDDFLFYGRTLVKADQTIREDYIREQYGLDVAHPTSTKRGGDAA
jgi:hypothetical protein